MSPELEPFLYANIRNENQPPGSLLTSCSSIRLTVNWATVKKEKTGEDVEECQQTRFDPRTIVGAIFTPLETPSPVEWLEPVLCDSPFLSGTNEPNVREMLPKRSHDLIRCLVEILDSHFLRLYGQPADVASRGDN